MCLFAVHVAFATQLPQRSAYTNWYENQEIMSALKNEMKTELGTEYTFSEHLIGACRSYLINVRCTKCKQRFPVTPSAQTARDQTEQTYPEGSKCPNCSKGTLKHASLSAGDYKRIKELCHLSEHSTPRFVFVTAGDRYEIRQDGKHYKEPRIEDAITSPQDRFVGHPTQSGEFKCLEQYNVFGLDWVDATTDSGKKQIKYLFIYGWSDEIDQENKAQQAGNLLNVPAAAGYSPSVSPPASLHSSAGSIHSTIAPLPVPPIKVNTNFQGRNQGTAETPAWDLYES